MCVGACGWPSPERRFLTVLQGALRAVRGLAQADGRSAEALAGRRKADRGSGTRQAGVGMRVLQREAHRRTSHSKRYTGPTKRYGRVIDTGAAHFRVGTDLGQRYELLIQVSTFLLRHSDLLMSL